MTGRVIILNGVSSAGKSTIARELQDRADFTLLHVEMGKFLSFLPNGDEFKPDWFELVKVQNSAGKLPRIVNGPRGEKLLKVMRQFVIHAAHEGLDMVVDEVCHAAEIADYREGLAGCRALFVKILAPLDELERRERARGNRLIGLAREQSGHLHQAVTYDLEINTLAGKTTDQAAQILRAVND
ncbi:MAG: chloramphenicol phosphotransferase [Pseudomonadota bacterium]